MSRSRFIVLSVGAALGCLFLLVVGILTLGGSEEGQTHGPHHQADPGSQGNEGSGGVFGSMGPRPRALRDQNARGGMLEGRVFDFDTGEPVADAELTFSRAEKISSTVTNLEGEFLFRASEPGVYELATVTAQGYLPFAPELGHSPIRLHAEEGVRIRDITIHLRPALEYVARVVDPEGQPVAGAELLLLSAPGQTSLSALNNEFVTDGEGQCRFEAPDYTLVEARHEGFGPGRVRLDREAKRSRRVEIRLRPDDGDDTDEIIAGQVLGPSSEPIGGALVTARFFGRGARLRTSAQGLTDNEGFFLIEGLDPGRYHLFATADGFAPGRALAVPAGTEEAHIALSHGGQVVGSVTDGATGEAVPSFSVVVRRMIGPLARAPYRTETVFDAEGRYEITGVEPGPYAVVVTAHGRAPTPEKVISVQGTSSARADFAISSGGSVTGNVVDASTGQPLSGARISLEARMSSQSSPVPLTARTVSEYGGRFEIRGVAEGVRSLVVSSDGYHRRIFSGLQIRQGAELGPIEVQLTPTEDGEEPNLELEGIGAVLAPRGEGLVVIRLVSGGGAAEVGLAVGDLIVAVDGQAVTQLGFEGSIERIRGVADTTVRLRVRQRSEGGEVADLVIPRRRIRTG